MNSVMTICPDGQIMYINVIDHKIDESYFCLDHIIKQHPISQAEFMAAYRDSLKQLFTMTKGCTY